MAIKLFPYSSGSASARLIADALGAMILRRENSAYVPRAGDTVVNWGSTSSDRLSRYGVCTVFNRPENVRKVTDKLRFFQQSRGLFVPEWTTDRTIAATWPKCYSRTETDGFNGSGIVVTRAGEQPPVAPLYVKGVAIHREFRVYVAFGQVIDTQRKVAPRGRTPTTWDVRTDLNGFLFSRSDGVPLSVTERACVLALEHYGLDFGGVDVVEDVSGIPYILEINTAPGVEGTSVTRLANALREKINENQNRQGTIRTRT